MAYLPTTFTRSVSYFHPTTDMGVFIYGTMRASIIIIQEKDLWGIIKGGQSTNNFPEATDKADGRRSGI